MNPLSAALALACLLPLAAGGAVTRMRPLLGTFVEITAEGSDEARAARAIDSAFAAIEEVDRLLSSHRADSELATINAAAGERAVAVSPWTWECLSRGVEIGRASGGAFDVTCQPMLALWGFFQKRGYRVPSAGELAAVRPLVDYRNVLLLRGDFSTRALASAPWSLGERRVGLLRPGMRLDVGGIGKGFAADKAVEALRAAGVRSGLVRCWGDLRAFGPRTWRVGVADPARPDRAAVEMGIRDEGFSTAGDYRNAFEVNGRRYSHVLDPRTGMPVRRFHSCSVRAPSGTLADAWSTALLVDPGLSLPAGVRVADLR